MLGSQRKPASMEQPTRRKEYAETPHRGESKVGSERSKRSVGYIPHDSVAGAPRQYTQLVDLNAPGSEGLRTGHPRSVTAKQSHAFATV